VEAAEAAETDAYIWGFFQAKMGLQPERVGAFLMDFRKWRESHAGARAAMREDFAGDEFKVQREQLERPVE